MILIIYLCRKISQSNWHTQRAVIVHPFGTKPFQRTYLLISFVGHLRNSTLTNRIHTYPGITVVIPELSKRAYI